MKRIKHLNVMVYSNQKVVMLLVKYNHIQYTKAVQQNKGIVCWHFSKMEIRVGIIDISNIKIEQEQVCKMRLLGKLKHLVTAVDFFYSTEMLRYDDDLQYKTLTGGIISVAIILTIFAGFATMILNTLELNTFTIATEVIKNAVPPASALEITPDSRFRIAVEVWRQNLSDTKRYFDVTFTEYTENYGVITNSTNIPLETCTKEYFKDYPEIANNFDRLQSGYWLCPSMNTTLSMIGKYSSETYKENYLQVSACQNSTDPARPCASAEEIQNYFAQNQDFFYFTVYFSNTQINPDSKDYLHMYIEDKTYSMFGDNIGSQSYLYFSDYTVQTDQSIWPFSKIETKTGCLAEDLAVNHPFQTNINGTYAAFSIAKSSNSIVYTREVQKLSAVFSFMGGMIGAVSAVLFVIKIYTSLSYQFSIAFQIFRRRRTDPDLPDETSSSRAADGQQAEAEPHLSMNLINFIRYYIYIFCQKMGCLYEWPEMEYANECKHEILKQLDVKLLLKRIIFIEHCLTYLIDDYQLDALQIKKPETPSEIREIRLKCESIVDRQFSIQSQQMPPAEEKQIKKQPVEAQTLDSPYMLGSNASPTVPKEKEGKAGKQKLQQPEDAKNAKQKKHVVVMDMETIQDQKEVTEYFFENSRQRSKVQNSYKREKTRKLYLMQLQADAEQGNPISNKIWNNLDEKIKKSVKYIEKQNNK